MKNFRLLGMGLGTFLLFGGICRGQDSLNVTKVGQLEATWGQANDVALAGDYAFLAAGGGLQVIDISIAANPLPVAFCPTPGEASAVVLNGGYAYLITGTDGLRILDISDPLNPSLLGHYLTNLPATSVAVRDTLVYLTDCDNFYILEVSDPSQPNWVGGVDSLDVLADIELYGDYVLISFNFAQSVYIYDVSDPRNPEFATYYTVSGPAGDIEISGTTAFTTNDFGAVHVADVSNPTAPVSLGWAVTRSLPGGIAVSGSHLYATYNGWGGMGYHNGLQIFNVADPANPQETGYYDTEPVPLSVAVSGEYAYVAEGEYFSIYDCSLAQPVKPIAASPKPFSFTLHPPHPNPFNPSTVLTFDLPAPGMVKLEVFDINGRAVLSGSGTTPTMYPAGTHQIPFDGSNLPSGIYFARLTSGTMQQTQKMVLMK